MEDDTVSDQCPQRGNRSTGTVGNYTRMLLAGHTLESIGQSYGVTHGAVRKALKAAGLPTNSRRMLAAIPEGCTPTDAAVLRVANQRLAQENHELRARLATIERALRTPPTTQTGAEP